MGVFYPKDGRAKEAFTNGIENADGTIINYGSGNPEGVVTALKGSLHVDESSIPSAIYIKETGIGNVGWKKLISDSGEISPPDNTIFIRSDEDEIEGKQYKLIDNAIAYINGLVTPPSASNRWGIVAGGYQNITQPIPNWTGIIGEENLVLYGMIDTMAAEDPSTWEVSGQIYICNARLDNLDLSATNYLYLKDCFVNYATPTGGSLYAVNTSFNSEVVITNINLAGLTSFVVTNCALGQGIYPNASSSFVLVYKSVLNYYGWVGEFNGGTFDDCTIEGSPIGNPVFNANIYDFRNGNIVWSSNSNFTIKNGETWTIQGTPCFFLNPIYGFDVLTGGTLNTRGIPMGTAPVTVQVGGNWNNTIDKYDNRASGLTSTEVQGAIDELAATAIGFIYTNYVFVSQNSTLAIEKGTIEAPFKTIQAAINYFGLPTNAADYQRRCMINVLDSGTYVENLVVPHRALTILGSGFTLNGTITREIDDNLEFGVSSSVFRARFSLIGLGTSARDSHTGFVNGIRVTGNYTETLRSGGVGNTTHDTYFENVRLDGILGGTAGLGQNVSYWYGCRFTNNITDTNIYLQRGYNTRIDGTMSVGQIVNLDSMEFNNTTLSCLTSILEQGWRDCSFLAATTFTINAAQTIAVDSQTDKSILANVTFTNAPTKVYLEGSSSIQNQSTVGGTTVTDALNNLVLGQKYLVTVGATGADYTTLNAAIDAVAARKGGIIKIIDEIHNYASGGLAKDVSNITFMGKSATTAGGSVLFWNSGAGAWTGDNVSFINLSLRARPGSSGNLLTASATGKYYFRDCHFVGIDGSTSPSLATSILNCNSQECYVSLHNTQMQGPAAPGNRNIVINCSSATVWMTGRSRWNGTACLQMYRDAGSILAGVAPTTDTKFDDHNVLTNLQLAATGVTYGHVDDQTQTIAGVKTFSSFPLTPSSAPTTDYQTANKKYVDDKDLKREYKRSVTVCEDGTIGTDCDYNSITAAIAAYPNGYVYITVKPRLDGNANTENVSFPSTFRYAYIYAPAVRYQLSATAAFTINGYNNRNITIDGYITENSTNNDNFYFINNAGGWYNTIKNTILNHSYGYFIYSTGYFMTIQNVINDNSSTNATNAQINITAGQHILIDNVNITGTGVNAILINNANAINLVNSTILATQNAVRIFTCQDIMIDNCKLSGGVAGYNTVHLMGANSRVKINSCNIVANDYCVGSIGIMNYLYIDNCLLNSSNYPNNPLNLINASYAQIGKNYPGDINTTGQYFESEPDYLEGFSYKTSEATPARLVIRKGRCKDSTNIANIVVQNDYAIYVDATVAGANGLDANAVGNFSASNWFDIYVIYDSRGINPVAGLAGRYGFGVVLPAGYDRYRRIGQARCQVSNTRWHYIDVYGMGRDKEFVLLEDYTNRQWGSFSGGAASGMANNSVLSPRAYAFCMSLYTSTTFAGYMGIRGSLQTWLSDQFRIQDQGFGGGHHYWIPINQDNLWWYNYNITAGSCAVYSEGWRERL